MTRKIVYRVGDDIEIINPKPIQRVGYPKSWHDYFDDEDNEGLIIAQEILENPQSWRQILKNHIPSDSSRWRSQLKEPYHKVSSLSAYLQAKKDGFGGKERSIHYYNHNEHYPLYFYNDGNGVFKPIKTTVLNKRVVKTGTYYPPRYPRYYDDEYEPGGLTDIKTHVIVTTQYGNFHTDDIRHCKSKGNI